MEMPMEVTVISRTVGWRQQRHTSLTHSASATQGSRKLSSPTDQWVGG